MAKKRTFAEAYQELEKITQAFEAGEVELEDGIEKFKEAAKLAAFLKKRLNELKSEIDEVALKMIDETDNTVTDEALEDGEENRDIPF